MKISTKKADVQCLSRNPRQCMLQVSSNCSLSICLNLFRVSAFFACDKTVLNQRTVGKSAFEDQSEENSV